MAKNKKTRNVFIILIFIVAAAVGIFYCVDVIRIGNEIDSYKGVPVYYNGILYTKSHGNNYSKDNYYFGQKWQCVEYVKRFYYVAKNHKMPEVYGNAKDFFDSSVKQGEMNKRRGLLQYINGGNVKPAPDDLLVFTDTKFGHVGIVIKVGKDYVEIIQQNIYGKTRAKYKLKNINGNYFVGEKRKPAGWLRKMPRIKLR